MSTFLKLKHKLKRQRLPFILIALVLAVAFSNTISAAFQRQPFTSVEVAIAEHSPVGPLGGAVVPASCPSYAHGPSPSCPSCDSSSIYGQTTSSYYTGDGSYSVTTDTCEPCPAGQQSNADHTACGTPPSCTVSTTPSAINSGQSSTLAWSSSNATAASIDNGVGAVALNGSATVSPTSNTTYTLTVSNAYGIGSCSAGITVRSCVANVNQSCTSAANSCGQTNTGTIQCDGSCSATAPADTLCPTKPDLTASAITPTTGSTTASISYTATISNLTGINARSSSTLFQKANDASGTGFVDLGTAATVSIIGNSSVVATRAFRFSSGDAGTTKYLRACADTTTLVDETNEGNNCGPWTAVYIQPVGGICSSPPANYGSACPSAPNCAGTTNTGTIQCDGSCSASAPADPAGGCSICSGSPPANYGNSCQSAANCVGNRNTGTILCNGSCSASAPADPVSGCDVPSLSLQVDKNRVHPNDTVKLTWWAHKVVNCSLTGPSTSAFGTGDADHNIPTRITTSAAITGQSIFTLSCEATNGNTISATQTVNMVPDWVEL